MRKACLLFLTLVLITIAGRAQDVITLTNGTQVQAKVLEVNPDNVKYKDYNNQDGPTITILKSGIVSIAYANGSKTVFNEASGSSSDQFVRSSNGRPEHSSSHHEPDGYRRKRNRDARLHGWYFGAELSFGSGQITSNDESYSVSGGDMFAINLCATYMFTQHLGLQFGLGAEAYAYAVNYGGNDIYSMSYYDIPVRLLYCSNSKKKAGFYAMAGFDFAFLDHAGDQEGDDITDYYNSVLISPYLGCGVEFRVHNGRAFWMFGPYFRTSLGNVYSENGEYASYGGLNSGNTGSASSFGLSIIYMTKFGRR